MKGTATAVLVLLGTSAMCGGGGGGDDTSSSAPTDAPTDTSSDPDPEPEPAPGFCGDGTCEASEGESCGACPEDCDTQAEVCGNGACDSSEDYTSCELDCGPETWDADWASFEDALFDLINDTRLAGGSCPDGTVYGPQSALPYDAGLQEAARLHSWDMAQNDYFSHDSCNGRTASDRADAFGVDFAAENLAGGYASPQAVLDGWLGSNGHCTILFSDAAGSLALGVAEADDGFTYATLMMGF